MTEEVGAACQTGTTSSRRPSSAAEPADQTETAWPPPSAAAPKTLWVAEIAVASLGCTRRTCFVGAAGSWWQIPKWSKDTDVFVLAGLHALAWLWERVDVLMPELYIRSEDNADYIRGMLRETEELLVVIVQENHIVAEQQKHVGQQEGSHDERRAAAGLAQALLLPVQSHLYRLLLILLLFGLPLLLAKV